jgi:hypothetical protein
MVFIKVKVSRITIKINLHRDGHYLALSPNAIVPRFDIKLLIWLKIDQSAECFYVYLFQSRLSMLIIVGGVSTSHKQTST